MHSESTPLRIRRALFTASDKVGIVELARAMRETGTELVATGRTAKVLEEAGLPVTPIEQVSGSPEAFRGRMKTLSFPVCSGILYRRGDAADEKDLATLNIPGIDCVVVNFYPFESTSARNGITRAELIEEVDIGGPTLVRAAAKNAPDVLVLTAPAQYAEVIAALHAGGTVSAAIAHRCAAEAWDRILEYDSAIAAKLGLGASAQAAPAVSGAGIALRYGENPHQSATLSVHSDSPIAWDAPLTDAELSYNNILDLSAAYALASDLRELNSAGNNEGAGSAVVIVKHNNPCGVAWIPHGVPSAQRVALERAWQGDPVSAFGGVVVFTEPLGAEAAAWLSERFVEVVAAPGLTREDPALIKVRARRKNLKAVAIRRFGELPAQMTVAIPGGTLTQTTDVGLGDPLKAVTRAPWPAHLERLSRFGIAITRSLKSNALSLVREIPGQPGALQLVGTGQGQPNRVEALERLAIPRARAVLKETGGELRDCLLVSDAFFPFRDTVDLSHQAGLRYIIQPGGSIKDAESIAACDEHGMAMAFTGVRHFRH